MSSPVIATPKARYTLLFNGLNVAAGTYATSISGGLGFPYRIIEAKFYFLDDAVPDMRYYLYVGSSPSGSTTGMPEGSNVLSPYSGSGFIRGGQGMVKVEPMYDVTAERTYIKVHVFNNDAIYAVDYSAQVVVERL